MEKKLRRMFVNEYSIEGKLNLFDKLELVSKGINLTLLSLFINEKN